MSEVNDNENAENRNKVFVSQNKQSITTFQTTNYNKHTQIPLQSFNLAQDQLSLSQSLYNENMGKPKVI